MTGITLFCYQYLREQETHWNVDHTEQAIRAYSGSKV